MSKARMSFTWIAISCLTVTGICLLVFGGTILAVEGPHGIVAFWRDLILPMTSRLFLLAAICAIPATVVYLLWMINKRLKLIGETMKSERKPDEPR